MQTFKATNMAAASAARGDTQSLSRTLSRVLLQEIATGRYYQGPGIWSTDEAHALDFQTGSAARECAVRSNLTNVRIVMTHEFRDCQTFRLKTGSTPSGQP